MNIEKTRPTPITYRYLKKLPLWRVYIDNLIGIQRTVQVKKLFLNLGLFFIAFIKLHFTNRPKSLNSIEISSRLNDSLRSIKKLTSICFAYFEADFLLCNNIFEFISHLTCWQLYSNRIKPVVDMLRCSQYFRIVRKIVLWRKKSFIPVAPFL